ncbi:MAG: urease accessory protein UreF [Betaproteobacteria bacterium]|nr:urease accessory protein UreF [Betaproteobacteria bacterium]
MRLLQLVSPAFPVGAYSYSQGLEWACESGLVRDAASAAAWVGDALEHSMGPFEAPLAARMLRCAAARDAAQLAAWNDHFLSARESAELRSETLQMGYSLRRIARDLGAWADDPALPGDDALSYPAAFAWVCAQWGIAPRAGLEGYLWAWCENQAMAAIKCVPLGQTAGQQMLLQIAARVPALARLAWALPDAQVSNFAPGLAIASACHETQYSRLFRS